MGKARVVYKAFWCEPTEYVDLQLRTYVAGEEKCPVGESGFPYHNVIVPWLRVPAVWVLDAEGRRSLAVSVGETPEPYSLEGPPRTDVRWPIQCHCGFLFRVTDPYQVMQYLVYRRVDTGAEVGSLRDGMPIGAMWDAYWYPSWYRGPDGLCLVVMTPGGEWTVDFEASNCTDPAAKHGGVRTHYCWVRHGDPTKGNVHVDKRGVTCKAGAGSILQGTYHGFLHDGWLRPA